MKQNEILATVGIGIFVAVIGWVFANTFISKPEDRVEDVVQVRTFDEDYDPQALIYLKDDNTKIYTVDVDVEGSVGSGNNTPFTGQ